jgi:predicted phage terminase large subunit-like protein
MAKTYFAQRYRNPFPVPSFHEELWELCCSDHKLVGIAAPRGFSKTTAITGSYLLSTFLFRERRYGIIISDTEDQAAEFLAEIKTELVENEDLIRDFGVDRLLRESQTDLIVRMADGHLFRILARGAEQKVRGRKWRGTRPDIIVCDDLENEELTSSEFRRAKMKKWFYGSVIPCLSDDGIIRVVGTIIHYESLLEGMMPDDDDEQTVLEPLRKYAFNEWASVKYQAHNDDFSLLLWPEKFPADRLKRIQSRFARAGEIDTYSAEYRNEPITDDNAFFESGDFLPLEERDKEKFLRFYAAADLAISEKDRRAYSVIMIVAVDEDNKIQVRDVRRGRWNGLRIIEEIFNVQLRYHPEIFFMEDENIRKSLAPEIEKQMFERARIDPNAFINIKLINPDKDKVKRARPLQARMKVGGVLFNNKEPWYAALETEFRRFPKGGYKDQVDALGMIAANVLDLHPMTEQMYEEQEYRREHKRIYRGRDVRTGY